MGHVDKDAMVVETTNPTELLDQLFTDGVSTNATFYVAHITGDHPKYGLDRDFVTSQDSPYTLSPGDFTDGEVYEVKADDTNLRVYFQWSAADPGDPQGTHSIEVLDEGDRVDSDMILDVVQGDESASVRADVHRMVDDASEETLELIRAMLDGDTDSLDSGEAARVDLSAVPPHVRKNAKLSEQCFAAAFEKQTGLKPGVHLRAASLDASVLYQRRQQNGGGD